LERSLLLFIKQDDYLKVVRANHSLAVALRKEGQVELLGRRLINLARADLAGLPGAVSTLFFEGTEISVPQGSTMRKSRCDGVLYE
jgi:hypothetical protein